MIPGSFDFQSSILKKGVWYPSSTLKESATAMLISVLPLEVPYCSDPYGSMGLAIDILDLGSPLDADPSLSLT